MKQTIPELASWVESEWANLINEDFKFLRNIPSAEVQKFCDLIVSDPIKYNLTFLKRFGNGELTYDERNIIFQEKSKFDHLNYIPVSMFKKYALPRILAQRNTTYISDSFNEFTKSIIKAETPKAPETRRVLNPILASEFGAKLKSNGGGTWRIQLPVKSMYTVLEVDFGGFGAGFRYDLLCYTEGSKTRWENISFSYEKMLGILSHDWDLIRTDWLEKQCWLLVNCVKRTLTVLSAIGIE